MLTLGDFCRIAADLSYEEQMKHNNNVLTEPTDCPHYNTEKPITEDGK